MTLYCSHVHEFLIQGYTLIYELLDETHATTPRSIAEQGPAPLPRHMAAVAEPSDLVKRSCLYSTCQRDVAVNIQAMRLR